MVEYITSVIIFLMRYNIEIMKFKLNKKNKDKLNIS